MGVLIADLGDVEWVKCWRLREFLLSLLLLNIAITVILPGLLSEGKRLYQRLVVRADVAGLWNVLEWWRVCDADEEREERERSVGEALRD